MTVASSGWSVAVVIPARDEEGTIVECIRSVLVARHYAPQVAAFWIVVIADGCSDDTAVRARAALSKQGEVLECRAYSVGIARRLGTAAALSHFEQTDRRRLWLAHTDADTCVAVDWLRRQLPLAEAGSGAIAGIIRLAAAGGVGKRLTEQLMVDYQIGVDGTHPHVHGANLGVRADAYLDVGGWSDLKVAEDHCLWRRLGQRGWRLTSTAASVVLTSGRLHGRAAGGLADTLRDKAEHLRV